MEGPPRLSRLTVTQNEQAKVEDKVSDIYRVLVNVSPRAHSLILELWRDKHVEFLMKGLRMLAPSYHVLDANRPWLCYWMLHSIALLGESFDPRLEEDVVDFLSRCQDPNGGYGGGPGQMPHLATTYAAVNSLITLGSKKALTSINREKLRLFLLRMKDSSGAFRMHDAGEMDVRAAYTAISVASILNILDSEMMKNIGTFIVSCQTYEGGIAGEPNSEAHGGYTFCGLATMILIGEADRLDLPSLIDWAVFRQGVEGGLQGRTNKLVDGCYSFWQGAVLGLMQRLASIISGQLRSLYVNEKPDADNKTSVSASEPSEGELSSIGFSFLKTPSEGVPLFDSSALQQYLLLCSQVLEGGFKDKPGKYRDHYHTCYCLSGLSVCQYSWSRDVNNPPLPKAVLGPYENLLEPVHPLFNVVLDRYHKAHEFYTGSSSANLTKPSIEERVMNFDDCSES